MTGTNDSPRTLREALEHIDRDACQRFSTPGRCMTTEPPDQWCDGCIARRALIVDDPLSMFRQLAGWIREQYPYEFETRDQHAPVPRNQVKNIAHYIDVIADYLDSLDAEDDA